MQFSTITLPIIAILAMMAIAAPSANPEPVDSDISDVPAEPYFEESGWVDGPAPPSDQEKREAGSLSVIKARGFGCPFDKYQCDSHCRSLGGGRRGGYCGGQGWLHLTCICFK